MAVLVLRAPDLALACPMAIAIDAVAAGFAALSSGRASVPIRVSLPLADEGVALTMPASLAGAPWYSVKVVSVAPANVRAGRPLVTATVLLIDASSGALVALLDGPSLTALRTGAAGGVAARALARPNARRVALFGAGVQARSQLLALVAVRSIDEVRVVARDTTHTAAFMAWAAAEPGLERIQVVPASPAGAAEAAGWADIVVTATGSSTPVFPGGALSAGVHVTAVGSFTPAMRELDEATIAGARMVVDQRAAALAEAGELVGKGPADVVELGDIVNGTVAGRISADERTVFKSVGNAIQDLMVAASAYERARAIGLGEEVAFP